MPAESTLIAAYLDQEAARLRRLADEGRRGWATARQHARVYAIAADKVRNGEWRGEAG